MAKEDWSDWCWSNNAMVAFALIVLIGSILLYNLLTVRPRTYLGAGMEI